VLCAFSDTAPIQLAIMSSSGLPLLDVERRAIADCKFRSLGEALPMAAIAGVTTYRMLESRPRYALPAGLAAGAAGLGAMLYMGRDQCLRQFAYNEPNYPTAVVLRQAMRERDPAHFALESFDKRFPQHDAMAVRDGRTNIGELPMFAPPESVMTLLLAKGLPKGEKERLDRDRAKAAAKAAERGAGEQAAAVAATAASSMPSVSVTRARSTQNDNWGAPLEDELLTDDAAADEFGNMAAASASSAASNSAVAVAEARRARKEAAKLRKAEERERREEQEYADLAAGISSARSSASSRVSQQRKSNAVRYNQYGDEIVEDDSMESS